MRASRARPRLDDAALLPRRWPVTLFGAALALAVVWWSTVPSAPEIPMLVLLVAVYPVARHRPWPWPAAPLSAIAAVLALAWWLDGVGWRDTALLAAATATSVLTGRLLRLRSRYLAQRERRRRERQRLLLAAERSRIATELHDIVSHNLSVMVALADGAGLTAAADPKRAAETLGTIADSGRTCLDELRRLVAVLHEPNAPEPSGEPVRHPQPGLAQLPDLVDQVRPTGTRIVMEQGGSPRDHGPGVELAAYRIVQEALTNVLKHAGPKATATIHIEHGTDHIDIRVTDDGTRRATEPSHGRGLTGMAARTAAYGGSLEAGPLPGRGWQIRARLRVAP